MKTSIALKIFRNYQKSNLRPGIIVGYRYPLDNFDDLFGDKDLKSIKSEDVFHFLEIITENGAKSTKRHRYAQLKAFFNFLIMNYDQDLYQSFGYSLTEKNLPSPQTNTETNHSQGNHR
jgi:site-specific recombinase XerD